MSETLEPLDDDDDDKKKSATVLIERPEVAQDIGAIIRTIVDDERSRRRWQIMLSVAPWVLSGVFGLFAVGAGVIVAKRPVPIPQVDVAIYRSDGSLEAPVDRGNLSADRKQFIVRSDLENFIIAWESYTWRANQSYYNKVSTMTAGQHLQTAYQESWRNRSDPNNRDVKYGPDTNRNIAAIAVSPMPGSPFALTSQFLVKMTTPIGSTCEWWNANLTWRADNNSIPVDKQVLYDGSDTIVVSYFSTPANPAAKPWPC